MQAPLVLPNFKLEIDCSGGFYVRTLLSDLARECGSVAHMTALIRIKQGPFHVDHALDELKWNSKDLVDGILKCNRIVNYEEK